MTTIFNALFLQGYHNKQINQKSPQNPHPSMAMITFRNFKTVPLWARKL